MLQLVLVFVMNRACRTARAITPVLRRLNETLMHNFNSETLGLRLLQGDTGYKQYLQLRHRVPKVFAALVLEG